MSHKPITDPVVAAREYQGRLNALADKLTRMRGTLAEKVT